MGYKSRTDYIQEARVLYNMEIFPGGGVTLKEDILRVNARLIPSIYFLVVYTTTGKPQRSYDLHYRAISICVSRTVQTVVYWNKNLAGIFNQKTMYNRIPRPAYCGLLPFRRYITSLN